MNFQKKKKTSVLRVDGAVLVQIWRLENQESWWCQFQFEGWQARNPRKKNNFSVQVQSQEKVDIPAHQRGRWNSLLLRHFVLIMYWVDWMRLTHLREDNLLYFIDQLNVNIIQEHPHKDSQYNVWPNVWTPCDPVKLTHTINYHNRKMYKYWVFLIQRANI